jgi:hypothetical protein
VTPYTSDTTSRRVGFLKGKIITPKDFDTMLGDEITALFEGEA